jgi:protein-tyrosine phosphatase
MSIPHHAAALSGTWNFRDVGGIMTAGGPVRRGVVYRSAVLSRLDPDGQAALENLGVTNVFDLRGTREIAAEGADQVPESVTVRHAPFNPEEDETPVHEAAEAAGDPGSQSDYIRDYYAALPTMRSAQRSVASLLRTVATGRGGVLVHCAAGKDRTGWAIAAVLTAAGADREAVTADYLLSNAAIESLREWLRVQYPNVYDNPTAILGVQERFLRAAFDSVDAAFGSFDGYLDAIGVESDVVRQLRGRLLG